MSMRLRIALTGLFMLAGSLLLVVVAIPTLFLARRFYSEVIVRWMGRVVLRFWSID